MALSAHSLYMDTCMARNQPSLATCISPQPCQELAIRTRTGESLFLCGGKWGDCCLSLTFHGSFSLPPVKQELCFLPSLAPTPLPAQLPRKSGEARLHLAAGAWGFRESQGKV